jgi:O-methyltransferase
MKNPSQKIKARRTLKVLEGLLAEERLMMFQKAVDCVNYEMVAGDILEFGVFTGRTLAALSHWNLNSQYEIPFDRKLAGFDSFAGLPSSRFQHPRWEENNCAVNHLQGTPSVNEGEKVTEKSVHELFTGLNLPQPNIHSGLFTDTLKETVPDRYNAAAIVHIDCDLYESARTVLFGIEAALQDGSLLLFDDWFHYKGNPAKGEQRAFSEFLEAFPHWKAVHYSQYGIFCNAFIMTRS